MAWSFRAKSNTTTSTGTSPTGALPTGTLQGDLLVAFVVAANGGSPTITPPSGWSTCLLGGATQFNDSITTWSVAVHYRIAGASEPASWTWTLSATNYTDISVYAYTGTTASQSQVLDASAVRSTNASSTAFTLPTVTTSSDGDLIVDLAGTSAASCVFGWPTGTTGHDTTFDGSFGEGDETQTTHGLTTSRTLAMTTTGTYTGTFGVTAAFRPAPAPAVAFRRTLGQFGTRAGSRQMLRTA